MLLDDQQQLERAYKFSRLLKIDSIREEIEQHLQGYSLKNIKFHNGEWICTYTDKNDNNLSLTTSFNRIGIIKEVGNKIERIAIDEHLILSHKTIEKREKGLVYSDVQKVFSPFVEYNNQIVLVHLDEKRYVLTKDTLDELTYNFDCNNCSLLHLLFKAVVLEHKYHLKEKSDYYSYFSTESNAIGEYSRKQRIRYNLYPTRTILNDEDISSVYDISGKDNLYRIFDLYRGIFNYRNGKDIESIRKGLLPKEAFDLKGVKGITEHEDSLVGKSLDTDNIGLDRESFLKPLEQITVEDTNEPKKSLRRLFNRK